MTCVPWIAIISAFFIGATVGFIIMGLLSIRRDPESSSYITVVGFDDSAQGRAACGAWKTMSEDERREMGLADFSAASRVSLLPGMKVEFWRVP